MRKFFKLPIAVILVLALVLPTVLAIPADGVGSPICTTRSVTASSPLITISTEKRASSPALPPVPQQNSC